MAILVVVFLLMAGLAASNGANDVSKGVATLAGSGVTKYRTAIVWGAVTTLAGSLLSGLFADRMLKLFTAGIVSAKPTAAFTLAVLCGAVGWVLIATVMRLPVSTTHAIIGSLLGAGMLFAPASVAWGALVPKLATPLLISVAGSYAFSWILNRIFRQKQTMAPDCLCVGVENLDTGSMQIPQLNVVTGTSEQCATEGSYVAMNIEEVHWLSSGAVGFARGLNDTPKLVAIGAIVLGTQISLTGLLTIVALAMFAGSLYAGRRVASMLAEQVVKMDYREGLLANLATAMLVGVGANLGLPMSTTHVSTGAIAGIAGMNAGRLDRKTIRNLILAWTVTPMVAGIIAAVAYRLATQ